MYLAGAAEPGIDAPGTWPRRGAGASWSGQCAGCPGVRHHAIAAMDDRDRGVQQAKDPVVQGGRIAHGTRTTGVAHGRIR